MGVLDSFGTLASAVIAAIVMLAFSILSLFVMVFIVDVAAAIGNISPADDYVILSASIIAAAAIIAGSTGFATPEEEA
ncbi:hypothetical protein OB919_07665 [Halobacteria archaeon AArc-curdl1]|uniref:Uncharacterized protein n=1 Tax=Natronosalvus hydrolyticus TaxID=2979988 RepID=A0AAP3E5S1_9EURY|nr:hypothetical protein [Halobacteria archaeon AArc-curdl1]